MPDDPTGGEKLMEQTLCRPCAEEIRRTRKIKALTGKAVKITCGECGRRRFGLTYEVEEERTAAPEKKVLKLKATKTSLYKLVGEFEILPIMRKTEFIKAPRTRDWWLKWASGDDFYKAFFAVFGHSAALVISRKDWLSGKETLRQFFPLPVDKLRERGMIEEC